MKKADLDKRICDVEHGATNTETYREFIINAMHELYGDDVRISDIDSKTEEELNDWIDDLDYLLGK